MAQMVGENVLLERVKTAVFTNLTESEPIGSESLWAGEANSRQTQGEAR